MGNTLNTIRKRTRFFQVLLVGVWVMIVTRLFFIQVINSDKYQARCKKQSDTKTIVKPARGTIFDRNGKALTIDIVQYQISAHPYLVENKADIAQELASATSEPSQKYLDLLGSKKTFVWLEKNAPQSQFQKFVDKYEKTSGLVIDRISQRQYPFGEIFGQIVGFTNIDNRGICGLELQLEPVVGGTPGWKIVQRDGWGRLNERIDLPGKVCIDGNDVTLTIDSEYQTILHEELMKSYTTTQAEKAMGIIINPKNGEIYAMASVPPFNPNKPSENPVSAQKNQVLTDIFEPGSTFKVVTATAAMELNAIEPTDKINCEGGIIKIANRLIHDHNPYTTLTFAEVIKNSSNIGTIKVAQKIGKENVFNYCRKFGFGLRTNIQFPGEINGILHPLKNWTELMMAQIAMGQGIGVTVLQLAYAYAAIANGGYLLEPQLIKTITTKDGVVVSESKPNYIRQVASPETMTQMRELLRLAVQHGTGVRANVGGMAIAGKTGTSQKVTPYGYSQSEYVSTFAGFFPVNDPKLLCVVVVDNPKGMHTGGLVSAPVVSEIFKRVVNYSDDLFFNEEKTSQPVRTQIAQAEGRPVEQHRPQMSTVSYSTMPSVGSSSAALEMPDLSGRTARQALYVLQAMGLSVEMEGSGIVNSQTPAKGTPVTRNMKCLLKLAPRKGTD
ncbi:MAG: penicillin-binding protein [Candidatus Neomarinimicrobiota bacterium]